MAHELELAAPLLASMAVAAAALSARLTAWLPPHALQRWLPWLQAMAAGLLLGDALLHLLPEAMANGVSPNRAGECVALGLLCLLGIECGMRGTGSSAIAVFARMDIVGDVLHHLADGMVIGAAFAIDHALGFVVSLAVLMHELPREAGNAGVLIAGGYEPRKAFFNSVATTLAIPLGALCTASLGHSSTLLGPTLAVIAGTTLYLASSDILPGLWSTLGRNHRFTPLAGVAGGMGFMWLAATFDHVH